MGKIRTTLKHYINESKNIDRRKSRLLNESVEFDNKTIINVDIQPEYENSITFNLYEWVEFINESYKNNDIIFLYNGNDTLGMIEEWDYKTWLLDNGISEEVIYGATFYDKGYAFFRFCMDNSIDEENIADFVKYMIEVDITDSRDINKEMWDDYMIKTNHDSEDIRDLLELSDDLINVPDLMDFIRDYENIILLGGGIEECLKEVEIALMSLEKDYKVHFEYTY